MAANPTFDFRSLLRNGLRYLLPAAVSVVLLLWLFHKVDIHSMMAVLRHDCDYRWLLLMCAVLVMSRSVRGIRWGIQLRAAGVRRMPPMAEMVSIYGAYALDLVFSGVGEAWRCVYTARRQQAPISTVVGTDLGDRLSDAIAISVLIALTVCVATGPIDRFIDHYSFGRDLALVFTSPWLWAAVAVFAGGCLLLAFLHTQNRFVKGVRGECGKLWLGFKVLFTMKHQLLFWSYTVVIWVCYFLMTYLCFFAFPFTRSLITPELWYGLLPGLVVFVFGSISIAVPASGGLGPWNIAVMFALSLYGVDQTDAAAYSMVVWGFQTITQVLMGVVAAAYVSLDRRHKQPA